MLKVIKMICISNIWKLVLAAHLFAWGCQMRLICIFETEEDGWVDMS